MRASEIPGNGCSGKPDVWVTGAQVAFQHNNLGTDRLAFGAADWVQGHFGLWKPTVSMAAKVYGVSYGYVYTATHLSKQDRCAIERCEKSLAEFHNNRPTLSDTAIERFIDQAGEGRIILHINNRGHAMRVAAE